MTNVIAILDIGKTNKKVFLFNEAYQIVWEKSSHFEETIDEDGYPCEDVFHLSQWALNTFDELLTLKEYTIKAINFSTYGASFVYINDAGKVIAPLYNYLKPFPQDLQSTFYSNYGGEATVATETASPVLGHLNSGMQVYRIKMQMPKLYDDIKYGLHFPQYMHFLFSGKAVSETTSVGCHTALWDFKKKEYHHWVFNEEIDKKLAPFSNDKYSSLSSDLINRTIRSDIKVGKGLHDSSAALIPYLIQDKEPFILISTGTWNISLNPFNHTALTYDELQQDCLCFLSFEGNPVKASRLFAGYQLEQKTKELAARWAVVEDYYQKIKYNPDFLDTGLECYEAGYHIFMKDLVNKQVVSTNLIIKGTAVGRIFIDGGFSKNEVFMQMLRTAYPNITINAAEVAQASALGAALSIHEDWNQKSLPEHLITLK